MVPKRIPKTLDSDSCFRAVLFLMVPKRIATSESRPLSFRAVLFLMVPKLELGE